MTYMMPDGIRDYMIPYEIRSERGGGARSAGGPVAGMYVSGNIKHRQRQTTYTGHRPTEMRL